MKGRALRALSLLVMLAAGLSSRGIPPARAGAERSTQGHACVFDHLSLHTDPHTCRPRARAYPRYVRGPVERSIYDSALTFGMPYPTLLAIAQCESGLNPHASNGTHFGLFQFVPDTFRRAAVQLRSETGVVAKSYWNPLDAAYAAGYMFVTGESTSWSCVSALTH
jgi:hypothetical protein